MGRLPQAPALSQPDKYVIHMSFFLNARHRVSFRGSEGPTHSHSWRIDVTLEAELLDGPGQAPVEFAELDRRVRDVLRVYEGGLLNALRPFDEYPPTTENLGRFLFGRLGQALAPAAVKVLGVTVWEAPTKGVTVSSPLPASPFRPTAASGGQESGQAAREAAASTDTRRSREEGAIWTKRRSS